MTTRHIAIVAFPGVQALDVAGPHEVFATADRVLRHLECRDRYDVSVVSHRGGPIASESGLEIGTRPAGDVHRSTHTLIVPGGSGVRDAAADPGTVTWLAGLRSRRLATVCSGPFLAAAAGLLRDRKVTTHWARAAELAQAHPDLTVDPEPVYLRDGDVWSSAGVTAGIDLSLALVREDVGIDVAQTVAQWLVMFLHRPANQSQFAAPVWIRRGADDGVRRAQDLVDADPGGDHRIEVLADRVDMSPRNFQRRFTEQVGMTPGKYVAEVRLEAARRALEESDAPIATIAAATGHGSAETLRRTFVERLGASPREYRRRFTHHPDAAAPPTAAAHQRKVDQ
ncbi:MAG TPA: helix-turn-helix domain-containing protein [Acidimicrobiales bacterium]|nr:helix-turn-helix domain-containing protein [Acidimicrobiales bacterium]